MWFFLALASSVFYALSYTLFGQHFKTGSGPVFMFFYNLLGVIFYFLIILSSQSFTWPAYSKIQWWSLLAQVLCGLAANLLCIGAIQQKNAALASFVEICYPLFIALFAFLLFKDSQLTPKYFLGGGLILTGLFFISR